MPPPIDVRRRVYDRGERGVLDLLKDDYMNCTTPAQRKSFATSTIFVELFNYWATKGVILNSDEMDKRTEVCHVCWKNDKITDCLYHRFF